MEQIEKSQNENNVFSLSNIVSARIENIGIGTNGKNLIKLTNSDIGWNSWAQYTHIKFK